MLMLINLCVYIEINLQYKIYCDNMLFPVVIEGLSDNNAKCNLIRKLRGFDLLHLFIFQMYHDRD
jgi:hypothetical protein